MPERSQTQTTGRPNLVFVTTDTQGRNMVSAYGQRPCVETPHIDRMAEEGILFENAFVASPVCTPSRGCWFTGLPANQHGAWANELAIRRTVPTLAEKMSAAGYRCCHFGKWHLDAAGYNGGGRSDGGFEEGTWYDLKNFYSEVGTDGPNRFGGWVRGLEDPDYCFGRRVADRAIGCMDTHSYEEAPLFLVVEFDEPHGPYICPPPFRGRYSQKNLPVPESWTADLSKKPRLQQDYAQYLRENGRSGNDYPGYYHRYYDCNAFIDSEIGRVLEAVRAKMPPDTLVIFTSDHGDHLGEFGLSPKGPTMYDACTAVPLILWSPGFENNNRRIPDLVSSLDISATFLDAAGSAWPNQLGYSGRSLLPYVRNESIGARDAVFMEYNRFGLRHEGADGFYPIRCIRTKDWKLSINLFDTDELYCLRDDSLEIENRIDDPACVEVRNSLHDQLLAHMNESMDTIRSPVWGRRPWRPEFKHHFEGFFTTGYKDAWPYGHLDDAAP